MYRLPRKLDKTLGLVAAVAAAEFNKRFQSGDFGTDFYHDQRADSSCANRGGGRGPWHLQRSSLPSASR